MWETAGRKIYYLLQKGFSQSHLTWTCPFSFRDLQTTEDTLQQSQPSQQDSLANIAQLAEYKCVFKMVIHFCNAVWQACLKSAGKSNILWVEWNTPHNSAKVVQGIWFLPVKPAPVIELDLSSVLLKVNFHLPWLIWKTRHWSPALIAKFTSETRPYQCLSVSEGKVSKGRSWAPAKQ